MVVERIMLDSNTEISLTEEMQLSTAVTLLSLTSL